MTNPFYTATDAIVSFTRATASDVQGEFNKIEQAFDQVFNFSSVLALTATSSTSMVVGTGTKSFVATPGRNFSPGQFVLIAAENSLSNNMLGQITLYDATTGVLVVAVSKVTGSGTFASWFISLSYNDDATATFNDSRFTQKTDLASTAAGKGAALVGLAGGGTVQDAINRTGTMNLGSLASGSVNPWVVTKTATQGAADQSSQLYSFSNRVYAGGGNGYDVVRNAYFGTHADATGGTTNLADGIHAYVWKTNAGTLSSAQAIAGHIRVDGGAVGEATVFRAVSTTINGSGSIGTVKGLGLGDLGDLGDKVTNVYGIEIPDLRATSVALGIRSLMDAGTNKYFLYGAGTAPSAHRGNFGIGMTTTPLWTLSVRSSASGTWSSDIEDTTANPYGLRIRYSGSAANGSENDFLHFENSAGKRFGVFASGSVVNATNSYGAISDAKLKTDIRDAGPQLADIRAIRLRKYKMIADGDGARDQLGVIAQELEEVSPGLVGQSADTTQVFEQHYELGGVGEPDRIPIIGKGEWKEVASGTFTKNVNYSVLYLKAVKALQELADKVDLLEEQLARPPAKKRTNQPRAK